ncbi:hypothetical protein TanjilG_01793 [Lupinus angustifolius]|uniref:pectinesterase n=2 Tax=Lupinus angustifolius TaxID=3871 RepID=A0A1J7H0A5_LUPAN|nr:hypothetical protein TanjilG_01793 [Lupinus angustifolius]
MALLPRLLVLPLMLFISCSFKLTGATDCGGKRIRTHLTVGKGKNVAFNTIQAAIDSIRQNNNKWVQINIHAGTYKEMINISLDKPCIILKGAGSKNTIIQYNPHQVNGDWNPTFSSSPPNVVVLGITIKNTFGVGSQAVAAAIFGDKSVFYNCRFYGFQDTLLDSNGRHYFKNCYIEGEVDFIFGSGQSYYEDCVINATGPISPPAFITAQYRDSENDTSGFIFRRGSVIGNSGNVKLGRAYGPYSRVIFYETHFSSAVTSERWNAWNFKGNE